MLTYRPVQSYQDFYLDRWFRQLIVLMYFLSLAVMGDLLVVFPYSGPYFDLQQGSVGKNGLLMGYVDWVALDIGLLWVSTVVCLGLCCSDTVLDLKLNSWPVVKTSARFTSQKWRAQVPALACYFTVIVFVGASIAFDIKYLWRPVMGSYYTVLEGSGI